MTEVASDTLSVTAGTDTQTLRCANCAVGDIDGDGLNEILFLGPSTGLDYYAVIVKPTWDETANRKPELV